MDRVEHASLHQAGLGYRDDGKRRSERTNGRLAGDQDIVIRELQHTVAAVAAPRRAAYWGHSRVSCRRKGGIGIRSLGAGATGGGSAVALAA